MQLGPGRSRSSCHVRQLVGQRMATLQDCPGFHSHEHQVVTHCTGLVTHVESGAVGLGESGCGGPVGLLRHTLANQGCVIDQGFAVRA
eukprot:6026217-Alexandrium_andersonii.AAC.1